MLSVLSCTQREGRSQEGGAPAQEQHTQARVVSPVATVSVGTRSRHTTHHVGSFFSRRIAETDKQAAKAETSSIAVWLTSPWPPHASAGWAYVDGTAGSPKYIPLDEGRLPFPWAASHPHHPFRGHVRGVRWLCLCCSGLHVGHQTNHPVWALWAASADPADVVTEFARFALV